MRVLCVCVCVGWLAVILEEGGFDIKAKARAVAKILASRRLEERVSAIPRHCDTRICIFYSCPMTNRCRARPIDPRRASRSSLFCYVNSSLILAARDYPRRERAPLRLLYSPFTPLISMYSASSSGTRTKSSRKSHLSFASRPSNLGKTVDWIFSLKLPRQTVDLASTRSQSIAVLATKSA